MKLEVIKTGSGAAGYPVPVLFVHGAWHGAWCWQENFTGYFAERGFDCYSFSMRGHGKSGCEGVFHLSSVDHYVRDLESVVRQIGMEPVLVGHSMGGLVVQRYLMEHGAPAAALMASVPPYGIMGFVLRVARRHPRTFLKFLFTLNPRVAVSTRELVDDLFFSAETAPECVDRCFSEIGTESSRAAIEMMAVRFPRAGKVGDVPVLVLGGEDDKVFTTREVRATARAYGVEPRIFEAMGHDMMLDAGWRDAADVIINWLEEQTDRISRGGTER
jgi:hypothetical protein